MAFAERPYVAVDVESLPTEPSHLEEGVWRPVRHLLGIRAFGTNAYVARAPGAMVIEDHTERNESGTAHEELYVVLRGHAVFTIDGEEIDAPHGTLVFVRDPDLRRSAVAREAGTTVLAIGGTPGAAYEVSPWERRRFGDREGGA